MKSTQMTRRAALAAGAGAVAASAQQGFTAAQLVERIQKNVGVPWRKETVDRIVAGDPGVAVKGVATTMMATFDVVKRASAAGLNVIVTHEPTYYGHTDQTEFLGQDSVYREKAEFIRQNKMAVFRFHDHWHARKPDGIATGMMSELGWEKNIDPENPRRFVFTGIPLKEFVQQMETRLKAGTVRVVGDPRMPVRRVAAAWGYAGQTPGIPILGRDDVDVLVVGEAREWELVEYAADAVTAGRKKALIVLGHVVSEQAGMKLCATWLKEFVPEVPVQFVAAAEPFWPRA